MTCQRVRAALVLAVLFGSALVALRVPASEGAWLPAGLALLALTLRQLRRTSPESRRA